MSGGSGDIKRYFARIGYSGPREPTLAVLRAIVAGHTRAIPFENLDVLAKRPIPLDLPSLYEKLVYRPRGGYCFEHNLLLDVLRTLGFHAEGLAARVRRDRPAAAFGARTHMLLRVDFADGSYIADVGLGGLTPTAPLALKPGTAQKTPHESFRLVPSGDEFDLEARLGEAWSCRYRFSLQVQTAADYAVANWFTATHLDSLFVNNLTVSRVGPDRRCTLFNDKFTIRHLDGRIERRILNGAAEFGEVLAGHFGIVPGEPADFATAAAVAAEHAAHPDPFQTS
jgi:N-hydroxyarylamine O-acetyltransferase